MQTEAQKMQNIWNGCGGYTASCPKCGIYHVVAQSGPMFQVCPSCKQKQEDVSVKQSWLKVCASQ